MNTGRTGLVVCPPRTDGFAALRQNSNGGEWGEASPRIDYPTMTLALQGYHNNQKDGWTDEHDIKVNLS